MYAALAYCETVNPGIKVQPASQQYEGLNSIYEYNKG
jgi:hypothetical protein